MRTLEESLRRKRIDVAVSTKEHDYAGLAKDVLSLLTDDEKKTPVIYEYLATSGSERQWTIETNKKDI